MANTTDTPSPLRVSRLGVAALVLLALGALVATVAWLLHQPTLGFIGRWAGLAGFVLYAWRRLMDIARTSVNVIGNCLATVVIARWEGAFRDAPATS